MIGKVLEEKRRLLKELEKADKFISAFQDYCKHISEDGKNMLMYEGHDSHKDYYVCQICNKTESE